MNIIVLKRWNTHMANWFEANGYRRRVDKYKGFLVVRIPFDWEIRQERLALSASPWL